MSTPKPLTAKESAFIVKIAEDQFMNGEPTGATWTSSVCESQADKALLGSLIRKSFAYSNGEGSDRACGLTKAGLEIYAAMKSKQEPEVSDGGLTTKQIAKSFVDRIKNYAQDIGLEELSEEDFNERLTTFLGEIQAEVADLIAKK